VPDLLKQRDLQASNFSEVDSLAFLDLALMSDCTHEDVGKLKILIPVSVAMRSQKSFWAKTTALTGASQSC